MSWFGFGETGYANNDSILYVSATDWGSKVGNRFFSMRERNAVVEIVAACILGRFGAYYIKTGMPILGYGLRYSSTAWWAVTGYCLFRHITQHNWETRLPDASSLRQFFGK